MKKIFFHGIAGCVCILLLSLPVFASQREMTNLQYWLAPDHIQTILSFDREVQASYHHRSDPERFVLEIPNCTANQGKQTIFVNDIILQKIRVQPLNSGTLQVVFDLSHNTDATVQTLRGVNGQPDRVVVNLFDKASRDQVEQKREERHQIIQELKQNQYRILVLDPGHGGRDPGANKNGLKEKTIVMDLARRIQAILQKDAPYIKIYLTRDGDYFLPLPKRTEIAREYNADLFVSLHVNSSKSAKARGFSVYTLSEKATDAAAKKLAEQENAADLLFGGMETPTPTDEDSLLTFVLADLSAKASLQHSLEFGSLSLNTTIAALQPYKIYKEGLKRANFAVLRSADMPAVLVEACYLSNKREAKLLKQKDFRDEIAESLASSIITYFQQIGTPDRPQMMQARKIASVQPSPQSPTLADPKVHVVKSGESLSIIAGRYKVNLRQLRQINKLASADLIYVGQRLWLP
ncbi:MAG: LysM peptidoglycan-binding domain-containing protein [bacterium]|nr:LysM peptidoglycan-binding domain-containing protein [bacterium]